MEMGRVEVHAAQFLNPVLMGFDELRELGSSGFLSIDVQLGQFRARRKEVPV
jgi:hypothetical protein